MSKDQYVAFRALDPSFGVVMEGLSKFVDGEHYFDTLDNNVLFECLSGRRQAADRAGMGVGPALLRVCRLEPQHVRAM